jgi:hypothetical protein
MKEIGRINNFGSNRVNKHLLSGKKYNYTVNVMSSQEFQDFFRVYANLPLNIRNQVVVAIDGEPITWKVAFNEMTHNTKKGKLIYETLKKLKII